MLKLIIAVLEGVEVAVINLFKVTYVIGRLITMLALTIIQLLMKLLVFIHEVGTIFYEDFIVFAKDIIEITTHVLTGGRDSIINSVNFITCLVNFVYEFISAVCMNTQLRIQTARQDLGYAFILMANTFKDFFILIGNSMWLLLTFIPNVIIFLLKCLYLLAEMLVTTVALLICEMLVTAKETAFACLDYFLDVPFKSLLGFGFLIVAIVYHHFTWQVIKYIGYRSLKILVEVVTVLQRKIVNAMHQRYNHLSNYVRRFVARPRNVQRRQPVEHANVRARRSIGIVGNSSTSSDETISSPIQKLLRNSDRPQQRRNVSKSFGDNENQLLCVICQDRQKCVVLFPCRHLCLCTSCTNDLRYHDSLCPLCRIRIERSVSVFV